MSAGPDVLLRPRGRATPAERAALVARPLQIRAAGEVERLARELRLRAREPGPGALERAEILAETCRRWRDPGDPFRRAALASLVGEAGFAPATAAAGLDAALSTWTREAWRSLARREAPAGDAGAGLVAHVLGSALPSPNLLPVFFTLLAGGAALARAGRHLPRLAALGPASVAAVDRRLGRRAVVVRWPRERDDLTAALLRRARVATVTGGDAVARRAAALAPSGLRLIAHPDRESFACVAARAIATGPDQAAVAVRLAADVALHDQLGCLSPVGVVVEGGADAARGFAEALAAALAERERAWPRSELEPAEALAVRTYHDDFALAGRDRVLAGPELAWVVGILEPGRPAPAAPRRRCVWVAPADGARAAFHRLAFRRGAIACLGFIGDRTFRAAVVRLARRLDASRVAPLGRMQAPPLSWRQDGARPVLDLIAPEAPASSRAAGISGDHPW